MAEIIDGKSLAAKLLGNLRAPAGSLVVDIFSPSDGVQDRFVKIKERAFTSRGFTFESRVLSVGATFEAVAQMIREYNTNPQCVGIIVQLPLPEGISSSVLDLISPTKDIDCLAKPSKDAFYGGGFSFVPPTANAIIELLKSLPEYSAAWRCVVVGQGELVGRPVAHLLRGLGHEVQTIDIHTSNPEVVAQQADVIVTGVGSPGLVNSDWVKPGAIVVDAGTAEQGGELVGDVAEDSWQIAGFVTPVPGGVGPVTVACLVQNALIAVDRKA